jgi:hypothetical protein
MSDTEGTVRLGGLPRSRRSPSSVTRLEAVVRSSESIKQQRSMSGMDTSEGPATHERGESINGRT